MIDERLVLVRYCYETINVVCDLKLSLLGQSKGIPWNN